MPRAPKSVLWWSSDISGSNALSAVLTNKEVWLHGCGVRQRAPFQIRRRNLLTRIPRLGQRPFGTWVSDIPTVYLGNGEMRSRIPWQATKVSLTPGLADYFFTDNNGGTSGLLTVSNTPTFRLNSVKHGGGGLNPKIDVGISSGGYVRANLAHYQREYEFTFEGEVLAPQDPNVEVEVLDPGTSRDVLYDAALEILHNEFENLDESGVLYIDERQFPVEASPSAYRQYRYLASAMDHVDSFLGRRYIHFAIHGETTFIAAIEKPSPVSLTLRGDGPVRLVFAVQVRDRDSGTQSISEFIPVVVGESRMG